MHGSCRAHRLPHVLRYRFAKTGDNAPDYRSSRMIPKRVGDPLIDAAANPPLQTAPRCGTEHTIASIVPNITDGPDALSKQLGFVIDRAGIAHSAGPP